MRLIRQLGLLLEAPGRAVNAQLDRLAAILRDIPGTTDVRVDANPPKPELQVNIDRAKAMGSPFVRSVIAWMREKNSAAIAASPSGLGCRWSESNMVL